MVGHVELFAGFGGLEDEEAGEDDGALLHEAVTGADVLELDVAVGAGPGVEGHGLPMGGGEDPDDGGAA
jgi:hypothetical protein